MSLHMIFLVTEHITRFRIISSVLLCFRFRSTKMALNQNLYEAASSGKSKEVQKQILDGADVNMVNVYKTNGWTPLMSAAGNGRLNTAKLLIKHGAQIDLETGDGATALYVAAQNDHLPIVQLLLENGSKIDATKDDGWTPLMSAAKRGYMGVAKLLIRHGAQIDLKNGDGVTAFYAAAQNNQLPMVQLLLENRSKVDAAMKNGWTP